MRVRYVECVFGSLSLYDLSFRLAGEFPPRWQGNERRCHGCGCFCDVEAAVGGVGGWSVEVMN